MPQLNTTEKRPFLTIEEASQYLGISKNTIYRYTSQGALTFYKLRNRRLYFKIDDLNEFVMDGKNRNMRKESIESQKCKNI